MVEDQYTLFIGVEVFQHLSLDEVMDFIEDDLTIESPEAGFHYTFMIIKE